jgi:hypothetical protein
MDKSIAILVALGCIGLLIKALTGGSSGRKPAPVAKPFMTRREMAMLDILERLVPECRFHAQVSMGALLDAPKVMGKARHASDRNAFSQKIVDFVMQDRRTGAIVALIEIDDSSHTPDRDRVRDIMTAGAGYRTVRIGRSVQPNFNEVRAAVGVILAQPDQA